MIIYDYDILPGYLRLIVALEGNVEKAAHRPNINDVRLSQFKAVRTINGCNFVKSKLTGRCAALSTFSSV